VFISFSSFYHIATLSSLNSCDFSSKYPNFISYSSQNYSIVYVCFIKLQYGLYPLQQYIYIRHDPFSLPNNRSFPRQAIPPQFTTKFKAINSAFSLFAFFFSTNQCLISPYDNFSQSSIIPGLFQIFIPITSTLSLFCRVNFSSPLQFLFSLGSSFLALD